MPTMVDRPSRARSELEAALEEQAVSQERFEAAIGTSMEMWAYRRVRKATMRLAAADRALRAAEELPAPGESRPLTTA